jgi:tetratricopeptide (TPR) repeat protein
LYNQLSDKKINDLHGQIAYSCLEAGRTQIAHKNFMIQYKAYIKLPEDQGKTISILNFLGRNKRMAGDYESALSYYIEGKKIAKDRGIPDDHTSLISINGNIGVLFFYWSRYAEAEPLLRTAIEIDKKIFGENYIKYAIELNNLARLESAIGNKEAAEKLFFRVLKSRTEHLGPRSIDVAYTKDGLAFHFLNYGDQEKASDYVKQSLDIQGQELYDHPDTALSYYTLGRILSKKQNFRSAELHLEKAREIQTGLFGESHPATALTNLYIGSLCISQGYIKKSENLIKGSMQILEKKLVSVILFMQMGLLYKLSFQKQKIK